MDNVTIPDWNARGILPPTNPQSPTGIDRSPYAISLMDLVLRFAKTPERIGILEGFLSFRQAMHRLGLVRGFQWVDGSFLENIELIEGRTPHDIDIVTFFYIPEGMTQESYCGKQRLGVSISPWMSCLARTSDSGRT